MHNILIVGAGQLGSRHLQGAIQSYLPLNVTVIDPSEHSLDVAKQRSQEVSLGNAATTIRFSSKVPDGEVFDVCIVATTANVRYTVFKSLVKVCTLKNVIFEKVLFQKKEEYKAVALLLNELNIKAWVNCPRRIYPTYKKIKSMVESSQQLKLAVTGSNWGLSCNGIHFIDLFTFLTGESDISLDSSLLNKRVIESKRSGFYEILGTLNAGTRSGHLLSLTCVEDDKISIEVKIETPELELIIRETGGEWIVHRNNEKSTEVYEVCYQSQLTASNIEEIVINQKSSLTDYTESMAIHVAFIDTVKTHIEESTGNTFDSCPIT